MTALRPPSRLDGPRPLSTRRNDRLRASFTLDLETITPILGGGPRTRSVETVDVIRVPTVHGHLRFCWRALQIAVDGQDLFDEDVAKWGGVTNSADAPASHTRSDVELSIEESNSGAVISGDLKQASPDGYVLFPAREIKPKKVG